MDASFLPCYPNADLMQKESNALIVGRIEPEHAGENGGGFVEALQAPGAEATAVGALFTNVNVKQRE
jgi:hypothetical protein